MKNAYYAHTYVNLDFLQLVTHSPEYSLKKMQKVLLSHMPKGTDFWSPVLYSAYLLFYWIICICRDISIHPYIYLHFYFRIWFFNFLILCRRWPGWVWGRGQTHQKSRFLYFFKEGEWCLDHCKRSYKNWSLWQINMHTYCSWQQNNTIIHE